MKSAAVLAFLILQSGATATENLSGRVVGEDGNPITGVTLAAQGTRSTATTDAEGRFTITLTKFSVLGEWSTVRFSRDGYRPVTKLLTTADPVIILLKSDDSSWKVPSCTDKIRLVGFMMGFALPKDAKTRSGRDIDYFIDTVVYKKSRMSLGFGFNWSSGFPFPSQLHEMRTMSERDIVFEDDIRGVEYRGIRTNGTYYRFIGKAGETIEYDRAPKEAADYFNSILDNLCKIQPKPPGQVSH
jgi:hypothetical protein